MKMYCALALAICGLWLTSPMNAQAEPQPELRGIVNIPGYQLAILQLGKEAYVLRAGDNLKNGYGSLGKLADIKVLELDLTQQTIKTSINDVLFTNSLPLNNRPATATSWIQLQNANFETVLTLYARLANRTLLVNPRISHDTFSYEASWSQPPASTEVADGLAKTFGQRNATVLNDGDTFLQIVPTEMATAAALGAGDLKISEKVNGVVNFRNTDIRQVLGIYGKLINRTEKPGEILPSATINFQATTPLSQEQFIYALETLFRWNGVEIVKNDDHTFNAKRIASTAK